MTTPTSTTSATTHPNDLVFYDGEVGYFNGIVHIGHVSGQDIQLIERQQDGTRITIERA